MQYRLVGKHGTPWEANLAEPRARADRNRSGLEATALELAIDCRLT